MTVFAARIALVAATIGAFAPLAGAAEFKVPQVHPEVVMNIPDGWTKEQSATGFETRSPENNSIILGRTLARDRAAVEAWRKQANERLKAFGVTFDTNTKEPTKQADAAKPESTKPAESLKLAGSIRPEEEKSGGTDPSTTSALPENPGAFTFFGPPSLKTPGTRSSNDPVKPGATSVEALTSFGPKLAAAGSKLSFQAIHYVGAMKGKPVDVEVLIYPLPANRLFVLIQESGVDDNRAVAIARSVRAAK